MSSPVIKGTFDQIKKLMNKSRRGESIDHYDVIGYRLIDDEGNRYKIKESDRYYNITRNGNFIGQYRRIVGFECIGKLTEKQKQAIESEGQKTTIEI